MHASDDRGSRSDDRHGHAPPAETQHGTADGRAWAGGSVRLEVFARESVPPDVRSRQRAFVARMQDHVTATSATDLTVDTWPKQVIVPRAAPTEQPLPSPHRENYAAFGRWAEEHGYSLEPAFRKRERTSLLGDERSVVVDLPVLCVAIYEDDQLRDVFPRSVDGDVHPADGAFAAIDDGSEPPNDGHTIDAEPTAAPDESR